MKKHGYRAAAAVTVFTGIVATAGVVMLLHSRAATPFASVESEAGTRTANATQIADTTASNTHATKFAAGAAQSDIVVAIAGDIQNANAGLHDGSDTANLITNQIHPDLVLAPGDTQYESGALSDFQAYYSQTWGKPAIKSITYPAPGNHEYMTSGATGYYSYFSAANNSINGNTVTGPADQGYYAFNVGSNWRFYSMNSETNYAAQQTWLASDMAANPKACTLIFMHKPYWDYGTTHDGDGNAMLPILKTFYDNGGDLQFSGHEHNYQRFQPANPYTNQVDAARGIRSFVVGMGGTTNLYTAFGATANNANGLVITNNSGATYGVLKLTLHSGNTYDWNLVPVGSVSYTDSGSGQCH